MHLTFGTVCGVAFLVQDVTHHMGLYFAKTRGAQLIDRIVFTDGPEQNGCAGHVNSH